MITRRELAGAAALMAALPARAADRRALIRERAAALASFPGQKLEAPDLKRAAEIAEGTVFFYSRTPVKVGLADIDWTGGHIKHQEWSAQLNRFFHLGPLAAAYSSTKDERYAKAARSYIEDWIRNDPYPDAPRYRPGDNALNMSIRLGSSVAFGWAGTLPVFLDSPAFDDDFLTRMCSSMNGQATFMANHLTTGGNWLISELDSLVFTALRLPFLENASKLLETGITRMRDALAEQFLEDGAHIERTPGYHDWMTQVAVNYFDLARRLPEANAKVDAQRTVRSLDYGAQSELSGINDSIAPHRDPGKLKRLQARTESLASMGLTERVPADPPLDQVFPDAGQVFSRTAWKPGADYLVFDAGHWGGGHSHLSRLGFAFRSKGGMVVADPGILTYEMSDPSGPYAKSTLAHSTLSVEGWNQSSADAQLLHTEFTPDTALVQARYQGGWWKGRYGWNFSEGHGEGVWGEHERILYWVKREYLLIFDTLTTDGARTIHNCFQMGPLKGWSEDREALRWHSDEWQVQLVVAPKGSVMQCFEGQTEPLRGWLGDHGNDKVAAPQIEFRYPSVLNRPVTSVALIAPPAYEAKRQPGPSLCLDISRPGGKSDRVCWVAGKLPHREPAA